MTLQAVAGFLGQSGIQHPAILYRNFSAAHAGKRSGFFRYNDFALTPSGSAMSLNIAAGDAFLMGTESSNLQGGYYVWNNAAETLAWPAATSLPRIDSLILRVIDTDYGSDPAGSKATWEVVSGTPAASPVQVADSAFAPAGAFYHPGAWLRVANFQVPASATNLALASVTNFRKYARLGRRTLALAGDLPTDAQIGDQATLLDVGVAYPTLTYNGAGWINPSTSGAWTALPFASGYTDASNLTGGYPAQYRVTSGRVELRGSVRNTGTTNLAGTNLTVATLPSGARPQGPVLSWGVAQFATANPPLARREVLANGNIGINCLYQATWASLDDLTFYTV